MMNRNITNSHNESMKLPWWKQLTTFLIGWAGLQTIATVVQILYAFFVSLKTGTFDLESLSGSLHFSIVVNSAAYLILLSILLIINFKDLNKLFTTNHVGRSIAAGAICLACMLAFNRFYNVFLSLLRIDMSSNANEESIESIVNVYPLISLVVFGIVGPICEELTYRVGLFSFLRQKLSRTASYIVTIVFFAFIHFDFSIILAAFEVGFTDKILSILINELINIPIYAFAAFSFTMTFERHGFVGSLSAHIFNNVLSIGSQIILGILNK